MAEISEDAWPDIIPVLSCLTVLEGNTILDVAERNAWAADDQQNPSTQTLKRARASDEASTGAVAIRETRAMKKAKIDSSMSPTKPSLLLLSVIQYHKL